MEIIQDPQADLLWSAITVRISWELYRARVRSSAAVLDEIREHFFLSDPPLTTVSGAEEAATSLTLDYLERVRAGRIQRWRPPGSSPVDSSWRGALESRCGPLHGAILRLHFGEGYGLSWLARHYRVDPARLQAAVEALRDAARREWTLRVGTEAPAPSMVDALLGRIATASGEECPSADTVLVYALGVARPGAEVGTLKDHLAACPRCSRMVRLVKGGVLPTQALRRPPGPLGAPPSSEVEALALHLHPQGRVHRGALCAALGSAARPVGEDSILVDTGRLSQWREIIEKRVRMGLPIREHIRGALVRGRGRWTRRAILGPVPVVALEASRAKVWGEVDGMGPLPESLPPPPSVARWWFGAALAVALAATVGVLVMVPRQVPPAFPIEARTAFGGGAVDVRFDVGDRALLYAFSCGPAGPVSLLESSSAADKASFATGDGDYEVVTLGPCLVLVSSPVPIPGLKDVLLAVPGLDQADLGRRVKALQSDADVRVFRDPDRP